jgi:hypothetical protein
MVSSGLVVYENHGWDLVRAAMYLRFHKWLGIS